MTQAFLNSDCSGARCQVGVSLLIGLGFQPSLTNKHRVDLVERGIDLLPNLCTGENDLAANEDEEHDFGSKHAVDKTREQLFEERKMVFSNAATTSTLRLSTHLRLVAAELHMAQRQTFQPDRELDITRPNNVLNLELLELGVEPEFLDDPSVLARSQSRVVFGFGAGDNHLSRSEDERCRSWGLGYA